MAECSAETLLASGACFSQLSQRGLQLAIAQLLCAILNGNDPMATCDVDALLNSARCFEQLSDKQIILIQTQLLCEINEGSSGASLTVKEQDGTPSVANVDTITVSNGSLTDDGGGAVSLVTGAASAVQVYEGRDPAPPDNPALAALSYTTGGGTLTNWAIGSQTWV